MQSVYHVRRLSKAAHTAADPVKMQSVYHVRRLSFLTAGFRAALGLRMQSVYHVRRLSSKRGQRFVLLRDAIRVPRAQIKPLSLTINGSPHDAIRVPRAQIKILCQPLHSTAQWMQSVYHVRHFSIFLPFKTHDAIDAIRVPRAQITVLMYRCLRKFSLRNPCTT